MRFIDRDRTKGWLPVRGLTLLGLTLLTSCGINPAQTIKNVAECGRGECDARRPGGELPVGVNLSGFNLTVDTYESCSELQQDVRGQLLDKERDMIVQQARWKRQQVESRNRPINGDVANSSMEDRGAADSASPESAQGGATADESFTNVQEKGVDEADFVKLGTHQFFVYRGKGVEVVERGSLTRVGTIELKDMYSAKLFAFGDRLIVLGAVASSNGRQQSKAMFYRSAATVMPTLEKEIVLEGTYRDARLTDGRLIVVLDRRLEIKPWRSELAGGSVGHVYDRARPDIMMAEDAAPMFPGAQPPSQNWNELPVGVPEEPVVIGSDGTIAGMPCGAIAKARARDLDWRMTAVASINATNPTEEIRQTAILGGGDQIYMSLRNLYVIKRGLNWVPDLGVDDREMTDAGSRLLLELNQTTVITRIALNKEDGALAPTSIGAVRGYVKDQWAFREFAENNGTLVVATSTGYLWSTSGPTQAQNHLFSLVEEGTNLKVVGKVENYGTNENIRAIRYVDKIAYVVTFKNTDPLYAIDLSDVLAPKILGELKIPGFSTYMHPVGEGRMVGVGWDALDLGSVARITGVQVSLFDVADPKAMRRVDNKVHGDSGSYSEVNYNHQAFWFDPTRKLMGVPLREVGSAYGQTVFSGAVIYRVDRDALAEVARISHEDLQSNDQEMRRFAPWWHYSRSSDISRLYSVDGKLVSVSTAGMKFHDFAEPTRELGRVEFPELEWPMDDWNERRW